VNYRELLRVRRNLPILLIIAACFIVLQIVANVSQFGTLVRVSIVPAGGFNWPTTISSGINASASMPLSVFFAIAGIVTMIYAGILGTSLACENGGHLELAWTKPASRSRYALTLMAVDVAAMLAAFTIIVATVGALFFLAGYGRQITVDSQAWQNLARYLLVPFAWYSSTQALTASLRERAAGGVYIVAVVVAVVLIAFSMSNFGRLWTELITILNFFNPLAYAAYTVGSVNIPYPLETWELNLTGLVVLVVLGVAATLTQWRRLEA
jgi:hypothetical protein